MNKLLPIFVLFIFLTLTVNTKAERDEEYLEFKKSILNLDSDKNLEIASKLNQL